MTRPEIFYKTDSLPAIVSEAERHLIEADLGVYQKDGSVVRIGSTPEHGSNDKLHFVSIGLHTMVELMTAIITWKKKGLDDKITTMACPDRIAATYLGRVGYWRLPNIRSIIITPTMRPDGSILDEPGYDVATGLFYAPQGVEFPTIPEHPTREDARACLDRILGYVSEVAFVEDEGQGQVSRSVFLSAVISAVIRNILPAVPMHGFAAPAPGSGKSILVNAISYMLTGKACKILSQSNAEEMAKQLSSALQDGYSVISFDNVEHPIGGAILCQAVSEPTLALRVFGKTELKSVTNSAMYFATGNNLTFTGDIIRRAMRATIDQECERPEMRSFSTQRPDYAFLDNRAEIVGAVLTIMRAFWSAGLPSSGLQPVGSFEEWSAKVRNCLVWLGEPDPWMISEQLRVEDPMIEANIAAMRAWCDTFHDDSLTTKKVVDAAYERSEQPGRGLQYRNDKLLDALRAVTDGELSTQSLGKWLRGLKNRPFGGYTVKQGTVRAGNNRWLILNNNVPAPKVSIFE